MNPTRFPTALPDLLYFGLDTLKERGAHYQIAALVIAVVAGILLRQLGRRHTTRLVALFSRLSTSFALSAAVVFVSSFLLFSLPSLVTGRALEPMSSDEYGFLLTADTFTHGRLTNPQHPLWRHFENFYLLQQPTYTSKYFPAQAAALAAGWAVLGHPMHGVRLSGALACVAILWMLWGWFDRRWALFGALIAATSFVVLDWNQTYLGGNLALLAGALCLGAVRRIVNGPRARDGVFLGAGLSIMANSRPFEGLIFSLILGIFILFWLANAGKSFGLARISRSFVTPLLIMMGLNFAWIARYDRVVTGNGFTFPYSLYVQRYEAVPLFLSQSPLMPSAPTCVMSNYNNAVVAQFQSFRTAQGFAIESTRRIVTLVITLVSLTCLPFFALGVWRSRHTGRRYLSILILTSTLAAVVIFPFEPYYVAHLLPAVLILTIDGIRLCYASTVAGGNLRFAAVMTPLGQLVALLLFVGKQAVAPSVGHNLRHSVEADLESQPGKHLVVVREACSPANWGFVYNEADIDASKIVWARELDSNRNKALQEYYKDRRSWLLVIEGGQPHLRENLPR